MGFTGCMQRCFPAIKSYFRPKTRLGRHFIPYFRTLCETFVLILYVKTFQAQADPHFPQFVEREARLLSKRKTGRPVFFFSIEYYQGKEGLIQLAFHNVTTVDGWTVFSLGSFGELDCEDGSYIFSFSQAATRSISRAILFSRTGNQKIDTIQKSITLIG